METRGRKKIHRNGYKQIQVDKETHKNLMEMAEPMQLAPFLRHLARKAKEDQELKNKIANMVLDEILPNNRKEIIPVIYQVMIESALTDNPDTQRVGWYERQPDDTWKFNDKRFDAWLKKDNERRDRLFTEHNMQTVEKLRPSIKAKIFNMHKKQGLSYEEIAEKMGTIPDVIELVVHDRSILHALRDTKEEKGEIAVTPDGKEPKK